MAVHPPTIGVTELRRRASEVIEQLQESHEPLFVMAHRKSVAVLLNVEDYEALRLRARLMRERLTEKRREEGDKS